MAKYRFRALGAILLALGVASLLLSQWAAPTQAKGDYIGVARIDGAIDAISSRYLSRAISKAEGDEAVLIVIELDTPGGRLDSTRDMVAAILESRSPVAVYVTPSGAQAASAGTFITAAANFAVMEPTTNIGAASPISGSGEDLPSTLERKVIEDTRAFIRAISERRDRNAEALEATVTHARAYSSSEALDLGIIDFIAPDLDDLLAQVDGRTAETAAGPVVVNTAGVSVRDINMSFLERFLSVIADPNIAFTLISLGSLALIIEFWMPGFGPGIIGVIMLALAFVAFGQLPVNWVGVGLILFAMGLFYFEMEAPGIGVFGAGGFVSFLVGALLLFGGFVGSSNPLDLTVDISLWLVIVMGVFVGSTVLAFYFLVRGGGSSDAFGSLDGDLVGTPAVAISDLNPTGKVLARDREWSATMEEGQRVRAGANVHVVAVYSGRTLKVSSGPAPIGQRARRPLSAFAGRLRRAFRR
ncbi:MAG: nodulation protein NfeD [Dehalococcoidia bacterium]|nr:nodulation protein NfeD [Dehalococcoidia bacterium]